VPRLVMLDTRSRADTRPLHEAVRRWRPDANRGSATERRLWRKSLNAMTSGISNRVFQASRAVRFSSSSAT
jgi:hypothetical protein